MAAPFPPAPKESWKRFFQRFAMNLVPSYRGMGAWVTYIAEDFREVRIRVPLSLRTRNYVGTIYGGSMYGAVDPVYMIQFMKILGKGYIVWDKAATIRFRKPGKSTLYGRFLIEDSLILQIRAEVEEKGETEVRLPALLVDKTGKVHAEVEKLIYIASKAHYKHKKGE